MTTSTPTPQLAAIACPLCRKTFSADADNPTPDLGSIVLLQDDGREVDASKTGWCGDCAILALCGHKPFRRSGRRVWFR